MLRFAIGVFAIIGLLIGCGGGQKAGTVSGTVTYKGLPVKAGNIRFHTDRGVVSGILDSSGGYEVASVPFGTATVTIETESLKPAPKPTRAYPGKAGGAGAELDAQRLAAEKAAGVNPKTASSADYVPIPTKYADSRTSDLKVTIEAGNQTKDFTLVD
jgi:hypothetical protein